MAKKKTKKKTTTKKKTRRKRKKSKSNPSKKCRKPVVIDAEDPLRPTTKQAGEILESIEKSATKPTIAYMRHSMGIEYVMDPNHCTLRDLIERDAYRDKAPLTHVRRWAMEDKWVERRKRWGETYQKRVETLIGTQLTQARVESLTKIIDMQKAMDTLILKKGKRGAKFKLKPKSLEGFLRVYLQYEQMIDERRFQLAGQIMPQIAATSGPDNKGRLHPNVRPKLSEEEAYQAAKTILRLRREQTEQQLPQLAENPPKEETQRRKNPPKRVIDASKIKT